MTPPAPQTRRVNRGRGHSYVLDGQPVEGVTTIIREGVPTPALIDWAARTTAGYAVDHWDELVDMTPSARLRTLEKARWADRNQAGVRGTQIHALAEKLARDEEVTVPDHLIGHVDACLAFLNDWRPEAVLVEAIIGHRARRYMGTLDLVAHLAGDGGNLWLLDWKTGTGVYSEAALQLAAYRFAEFVLGPDGEELPMPRVTRAGVVHLRDDGYDLIPVEVDERAFRRFLYAQQVAAFARTPREEILGDPIHPQ